MLLRVIAKQREVGVVGAPIEANFLRRAAGTAAAEGLRLAEGGAGTLRRAEGGAGKNLDSSSKKSELSFVIFEGVRLGDATDIGK